MKTPDPRWSETITLREAYLAMIEFAWIYYRVGGETEEEIKFFAGFINEDPSGNHFDPGNEHDWFDAVAKARAE